MRLSIGTAQFGFKYGLNKRKIKCTEIKKIKKIIEKKYIDSLDTSMNYGESEHIIGNLRLKKKIITKITLPKNKIKNLNDWYIDTVNNSLRKLKVTSLYALLVHNTSDIISGNKEFLNLLLDSKKKKLVKKIGISVYEIKEIKKILKFWTPDIIQLPLNIVDQRFLKSNFLKYLKKKNIEIHARSCFLQGVLLKSHLKIGNKKSKKIFKNFLSWCKKKNINQLTACLHFIKKIKQINSLVVGFDNEAQLKEIIYFFNKKTINTSNKFTINEKKVIDPRKWNHR